MSKRLVRMDLLKGGFRKPFEIQNAARLRGRFRLDRFDKIQAITDVNKLARLEAYMRKEEFTTTADVARARLQSLRGSAGKGENPVLPAR